MMQTMGETLHENTGKCIVTSAISGAFLIKYKIRSMVQLQEYVSP